MSESPKKKDSKSKRKESTSENNKTQKASTKKEGFSILNSLARFMSREKSETVSHVEPPSEIESTVTVEAEIVENSSPIHNPGNNEMSSQTSELSVHRSSTLIAISKAAAALEDARRKVAIILKHNKTGENASLSTEETQTSAFLLNTLATIHHEPEQLFQNERVSDEEEDRNSGHQANYVQVSFHRKPKPNHHKQNTKNHTHRDDSDDSSNSSEVLFQSAPKTVKRNSPEEHVVSAKAYKRDKKGTQVSAERTPTVKPPLTDNLSPVVDREECPTCKLFEQYFSQAEPEMLNDKDTLEIFKRHVNSHLLEAQKVLNKLYKWPGKVTEIEDITEQKSVRRKSSNPEYLAGVAVKTNDNTSNKFDGNKYRDDNNALSGTSRKNKAGTQSQKGQISVADDEAMAGVDRNSNSGEVLETKEGKRDMSIQRLLRALSPPYDQILKDYLAIKGGNCSEEVIIRRKHCNRTDDERNRRPDSRNGYFDDEYKFPDNESSERNKSDRRHHHNNRGYENGPSRDKKGSGCFCERLKCRPIANLISSCRNYDDDDDDYYNFECSCNECVVERKCCSLQPCQQRRESSHRNDLSGRESELKWFLKGMLAALKGHHPDVNSGESDKPKREERKQPLSSSLPNAAAEYENSSRATKEKPPRERGGSVLSDIAFFTVKKEDTTNSSHPASTNQENANGKPKEQRQGGSVLSDVAFFMVKKEDVNNRSGNEKPNNTEPDPTADKQDMKNKPESGQSVQTGDRNFNLSDPSIETLIRNVVSAYCKEMESRNHCEKNETYENCSTDTISVDNSEERITQLVRNIMKLRTTNDSARAAPGQTSNEKDGARGHCYREGKSSKTCSYFYPICDGANSNRLCCDNRSASRQADPCCCFNEDAKNDTNCCPIPLQDAFQRYHTTCFRRVQMRQEYISTCKRERERKELEEQERERRRRKKLEKMAKKLTNCCRPYTIKALPALQETRNNQCGCTAVTNNRTRTATVLDQNTCEGFTYVVPQSQTYWQCFYE